MADLQKLYAKADKYLQRQKFESAFETFQEILRCDSQDEEALVTLSDLSAKLNRTADALRYQVQLMDFYAKRSDFAKAIATCRRILKLAPQDMATLMKLAGMLETTQKNSEALEAYREALAHFRKNELITKMIDCLTRVVRLDPTNLQEHLELADLACRLSQTEVAMPVLLHSAQLARRAGDEALWEKLVEQAHTLDPANEDASVGATELHLKRGEFAEAAKLVGPLLLSRPDDLQVLEMGCRSFLGIRDYTQAQPLCWKLYKANAERVDLVLTLLEGLVQAGAFQQVMSHLAELKNRLFRQGKRDEFLQLVEKVYLADESNLEVLEVLSHLYNELNKEDGLRRSLSRLFNLYLASENYAKAADILERILDVDPYGEGHLNRLENLEGHIDSIWYGSILARMQPPSGRPSPKASTADSSEKEAESFEDLLVEAEMYQQYMLSAKLAATLEKIDSLFPGAEQKNERLKELYEAARYTPKFKPPDEAPVARVETASPGAGRFQSLEDLRKISEITANIYRESSPQAVLQVAVSEIGRAMNASRCWGAIGTPARPPVITAEYCSPQAFPSGAAAAARLFAYLAKQVGSNPDGWSLQSMESAPSFSAVRADIQELGISSLHALPLIDKDKASGMLVLEQCEAPRVWSPAEVVLVKSIATQVVIAINNTKLRRLVRSMAAADPETGLLPRSAYLECLLSEARRAKAQTQPLSVCLLEPVNSRTLMKALGDAGVQQFVEQVGKGLAGSLRQNDITIRYSPLSFVVVFPDTALPQAGLAVEKARRALAQIRLNGAGAGNFSAAVCDVPLGPNFDAVDGVTEVINRLELVLDQGKREGGKRILISKFSG